MAGPSGEDATPAKSSIAREKGQDAMSDVVLIVGLISVLVGLALYIQTRRTRAAVRRYGESVEHLEYAMRFARVHFAHRKPPAN